MLYNDEIVPPEKPLLSSDVKALLGMENAVILVEDFNYHYTRWNCPTTNLNGRRLDMFNNNHAFEIVGPPTPTHFLYNFTHRPSTIDLALLQNSALAFYQSNVGAQLRPPTYRNAAPPSLHPQIQSRGPW